MALLLLPTELHERIFRNLPRVACCTDAIINLSQSCKFFHARITPILYHSISANKEFNDFQSLLSSNPDFSAKIQAFTRHMTATIDIKTFAPLPFYANLQSFVVHFLTANDSKSKIDNGAVLSVAFGNLELKSIKHLELSGLCWSSDTLTSIASICAGSELLTVLKLKFLGFDSSFRNEDLEALGNSLAGLRNLCTFSFRLPKVHSTPGDLALLFNALGGIHTLKELELSSITLRRDASLAKLALVKLIKKKTKVHFDQVMIDAPTLQALLLSKSIDDLKLVNDERPQVASNQLKIKDCVLPRTLTLNNGHLLDVLHNLPSLDMSKLECFSMNIYDAKHIKQFTPRLLQAPLLKELVYNAFDGKNTQALVALTNLIKQSPTLEVLQIGGCLISPKLELLNAAIRTSKLLRVVKVRALLLTHKVKESYQFITNILRDSTNMQEIGLVMTVGRRLGAPFSDDTATSLKYEVIPKIFEAKFHGQSKMKRVFFQTEPPENKEMLQILFRGEGEKPVIEVLGSDWDEYIFESTFQKWEEKAPFVDEVILDKLSRHDLMNFKRKFNVWLHNGVKIGLRGGSMRMWYEREE